MHLASSLLPASVLPSPCCCPGLATASYFAVLSFSLCSQGCCVYSLTFRRLPCGVNNTPSQSAGSRAEEYRGINDDDIRRSVDGGMRLAGGPLMTLEDVGAGICVVRVLTSGGLTRIASSSLLKPIDLSMWTVTCATSLSAERRMCWLCGQFHAATQEHQ
ncbi:hypothetical protein OBBRIDRAFT_355684 [Obba rivulosa]|uniref:Uncharacterized protein n=1 Tax=Obba rivulosa TaxID=1052685 RepID=A0A8E2DFL0_9APHY|nr:hypothetical protein OBBRIDRAFT_355684 [Obba rivulosa]